MNSWVVLIGALVVGIGAFGVAQPERLMAGLARMLSPGALWGVAALRVAIGIVFVLAAPGTRWPLFIEGFGWFAIAAGVITPLFGSKLEPVLHWWQSRPPVVIRAWCTFALLLGGAIAFAGT